ncbi:Sulphatase-modifying factor protein [Nitrosomonas sp. Is79A3]|uniref:SUMF1/EgtB/PvdO family nonheme iron enzyme n=1 Tax=Nitrosomonas sp. (strain Is79A3) TaxID=261292 RepID=UPI000215CEC2
MTATTNQLAKLRIFISYARGGNAHTWSERIQSHLEQQGAEVWRDERSIEEGNDNWYRSIQRGIEKSDVVVCIVGKDTDQCGWQEREMLYSDKLKKQVVALRIDNVSLPFYIQEKQPIEAHSDPQDTLDRLTRKLAEILPALQNRTPNIAPLSENNYTQTSASPQRRDELTYLNDLINKDLSDLESRYVALEACERRSLSPERVMKSLRVDTDAIFRAFKVDQIAHEQVIEKTYTDALDAYRDLEDKPVRRLAVLGEPGAGKSFSLQRISIEYARKALQDEHAPIPLLVPLGSWTREAISLEDFIEDQLGKLGRYFSTLRDLRRAVLLLDGMNEIPPGQRKFKVEQIKCLAQDERFASVMVSCREKDFTGDCYLPFDTLVLQPLKPSQIMVFLERAFNLLQDGSNAAQAAQDRFWHLAGGDDIRQVWEIWHKAGADLDLFWSAKKIPKENPNIDTSWQQNQLWREVRFNPRSLLRLASNPYLLHVFIALKQVPSNRAQLFQGFLQLLYEREQTARENRHEHVPARTDWEAALVALAEAMQNTANTQQSDGAQTTLLRSQCPASLTDDLIKFSIDASVLQQSGSDIRFTHQLLQEYLASRLLLDASHSSDKTANDFWPQATWWERSGWEVVAEIAAESCGNDTDAQLHLIAWLAQANPEVASTIWQHVGKINLSSEALSTIANQWFTRMTDIAQEPHPAARAAIGRALGNFGLDNRKGVGLRADGLPDIDWVKIPSTAFVYQDDEHSPLPEFHIARYPITHAQFQAFIDAGGYQDDHWWQGWQGWQVLHERLDAPASPDWSEPNAPRETVSWYEAIAFCRWLSDRRGFMVSLPTEQQWERAARGTQGLNYPWGNEFQKDFSNCEFNLGRTSAVGLYSHAASPDGVLDMAGNVWEWCLNEYDMSENCQLSGNEARVLRGGSWFYYPVNVRASVRVSYHPAYRRGNLGFRVLCSSPIE